MTARSCDGLCTRSPRGGEASLGKRCRCQRTGRIRWLDSPDGRCRRGHQEVVKLLLSKGANVNAKDKVGRTALKIAQKKGYKEIVELLKGTGSPGIEKWVPRMWPTPRGSHPCFAIFRPARMSRTAHPWHQILELRGSFSSPWSTSPPQINVRACLSVPKRSTFSRNLWRGQAKAPGRPSFSCRATGT